MSAINKGYTGGKKLPRQGGTMSPKPAHGTKTKPHRGPKPRSG